MDKPSACIPSALKLHRLSCVLERMADQVLQEKLSISFAQCMILQSLKNNPDCSQQCIAKCRDLTQAAVSRQIDALHQKKLVVRKENAENRREHILKMTDKGFQTLERANRLVQDIFDDVFRSVPRTELHAMDECIDHLLESIRKQKEEDCGC